jgi:hypothetical protein
MFPEYHAPRAEGWASLMRAVRRAGARHLRERDLAALGHDLARFPSTVAAVVGGMFTRRIRKLSPRVADRERIASPRERQRH